MGDEENLQQVDEKEQQYRRTLIAQYQGPIPSASELSRYDKIMPGLVDRIVEIAEREQKSTIHRENFELYMHWAFKFGAYFAVVGIVVLILLGTYDLFREGHVAGGIAGAIGAVTTVLVAIIKGANKRTSNK